MPYIELTLNHNRQEILRDGWGVIKTAKAFIPAEFVTIADEEDPLYPGYHAPSALSDNAVFEADSGVLRLKPNFQKDDFLWDSANNDAFLQGDDYVYGNVGEWGTAPGAEEDYANTLTFLHTHRDASAFAPLTSLSSLSADLQWLVDETDGQMIPAIRTANPLSVNEGFGLIHWNYGYTADREEFYRFGFVFGVRWLLTQHMSGKWELWRNWGTPDAPDWVIAQEYWPQQWAVKTDRPIQIAVVPMMPNRLAFYISDAPQPTDRTRQYGGSVGPAFVHEVDMTDTETITEVGNVWMYLQAGQLVEGELQNAINYAFAMHRVRYSSAVVTLMPEVLDEPKPGKTPLMTTYGHDLSGYVTPSYIADSGGAWDATTDRRICPKWLIDPKNDGIISPIISGYEFRIDATTYTPAATPIDISGDWFSLSFTLSEEPEGSTLSAALIRDADYDKFFKLESSLRLVVNNVPVWDGYIEVLTNKIVGTTGKLIPVQTGVDEEENPIYTDTPMHCVSMFTSLEGYDMWERLERTRLARYVPVHAKSKPYYTGGIFANLYDRISNAIERAGMPSSLPTGFEEIESLTLPDWHGIDDAPATVEDSSAADCIRDSFRQFGFQQRRPLRATWDPDDEDMQTSLGPRYAVDPQNPTEGELPTLFIVLEEDIIEEIEGSILTDEERWDSLADRRYLMARISNPESDGFEMPVTRGQYNALSAFGVSSSDQTGRGRAVHIAADPNSLTDPDHIDYQAGVRRLTLPPNETAGAPNVGALEQLARHRYDQECTTERMANQKAEWQEWVRPSMFVCVLGRNPAGEIISYGAYRIVSIGVELDVDYDEAGADPGFGTLPDRRYLWTGDYLLDYVGVADYVIGDVTIAMFTDVLPVLN